MFYFSRYRQKEFFIIDNINFLILQYRWPVIQEQDQTHINSETHSCELAILKLSCKL